MNATMPRRPLGKSGATVSAMGLGCMTMSAIYAAKLTDEPESIRTIHQALDLGIDFIDTADAYGAGRNEELVGRALADHLGRAFIATKFGNLRNPDGTFKGVDGSAAYVKQAAEASLTRLNVDTIDLFYLHRVDPNTPIEETVGAMGELVAAGKVRFIGLSEAAPQTLRRAHATHPVAALQTEYSLFTRDENLAANLQLADAVRTIAERKGCSSAQLALAWLMKKDGVIPIPGTKTVQHLNDDAGAAVLSLDATDMQALDAALPPGAAAGLRYPASQMGSLRL